jgi:hypothetical protein
MRVVGISIGIKLATSVGVSLVLSLMFVTATARATARDFNIVTNQSSITASGTVSGPLGTATIQPQGTGSLTTNYSGTIKTDLIASGISFLSGSTIDANTNGSWKPLADGSDGSAAADYGGKATFLLFVTVNFAGRNLVAGLTSDILLVDGSGHFDLSTTTVAFSSGDLAYRSSTGTPVGFASIAGKSDTLSGTGTLSSLVQGTQTTETLSLPVDSTFVLQPDTMTTVNLTLTGQLVATSTFATPLPGDYNQNGVVDAADYVVWRKQSGSDTSLPNDDTPGVGSDDFTRWRAHFGQANSGSGSGSNLLAGSAVPEPCSIVLLIAALIAVPCYRRARPTHLH